MGVVIFIGAAAAVVLRFWRWVQRSGEEGKNALLSLRTSAAAASAIAGSIFDILAAVTNAKVTVSHTVLGAPKVALPPGFRFGSIGNSVGPGGTPEPA